MEDDQALSVMESKVITVCYHKPESVEGIAGRLGEDMDEIKKAIDKLFSEGFLVEDDGLWSTTREGDSYVSSDLY